MTQPGVSVHCGEGSVKAEPLFPGVMEKFQRKAMVQKSVLA
jgi:hypothetical protein